MEPLSKSLINAVQFILCVQDSCTKHRHSMEHLWMQEYTSYINEWKQNHIEAKKLTEKKNNDKSIASESVHPAPSGDLESEELALVESVLRKARSIRIKDQKKSNGLIDCTSSSLSVVKSSVLFTKCSSRTSENSNCPKQLTQSKSDFIIHCHKNTVVPRSRSATVPFVPKKDLKPLHKNKCNRSSLSKSGAINRAKPTDASSNVNVISNEDLDVLKKLHVSLPPCNDHKKVASSSDSSGNRNQPQFSYPSSKEFVNLMKGRLTSASTRIKLKLWYPFLSSKSEAFLTAVHCTTFCSVKKAYSILCGIQETMMWLDLLYLMEGEVCPNLIIDSKDVDLLRIYSYLCSIFERNSQRIPMLRPIC